MDTNLFSIGLAAFIGALIPALFILLQIGAANKQRLELIYEQLFDGLDNVIKEMGGWDRKRGKLPENKKPVISRMLHIHLDSLVEAIAVEGKSNWRRWLYKIGFGKHFYIELAEDCYLEKCRYKRFEYWYSRILKLYNDVLHAPKYVEQVFHTKRDDPHKKIKGDNCLKVLFEKRHELLESVPIPKH